MKKYWKIAKKVIPGGNSLYSKRPEMFLPNHWPAHFSKSKDCYVWDLNNKKYVDMIFAVGTNVLGYNNKYVNDKVLQSIKKGNLSTLNSYDEVLLAEKLLSVNKWADMVKFARTGGEASAISIRIARAFLKSRQNVAICGYHGWHDWYLASNLSDKKSLNSHLADNVKIDGVNKKLAGTAYTFRYNDPKSLEKLLKTKKIGIIKLEVERNIKPRKNFLTKVRRLANKYKTVLIFDESTSGFRQTYGGLHSKYNVNPDIVIYGKAIGNGYAITAVLGKKKIMERVQNTFLSSTFWSERIGFAAACATIDFMKKNKTWKSILRSSKIITDGWTNVSKKHNVDIEIFGLEGIPQFKFKNYHNLLKTFFTKRMLDNKFLASNLIYISLAHKDHVIKKYLKIMDKIFCEISKFKNPKNEIKLKEAHKDFKKLN